MSLSHKFVSKFKKKEYDNFFTSYSFFICLKYTQFITLNIRLIIF